MNIRNKLATALALIVVSSMSFAQTASGVTAALDSVDLSGIVTKVAAAGLVIVAIALAFKGPDLAKRVTRKV